MLKIETHHFNKKKMVTICVITWFISTFWGGTRMFCQLRPRWQTVFVVSVSAVLKDFGLSQANTVILGSYHFNFGYMVEFTMTRKILGVFVNCIAEMQVV